MKIITSAIVALILFGSGIAVAAPPEKSALQAMSVWTNQRGSTFIIDSVDPSGMMAGRYINRAPGTNCQNIPFAASGWITGNAIVFSVNWDNSAATCNSLTSWTGVYTQGQIVTLWQMAVSGMTSPSQFFQGADTFSPSQKAIHKSLMKD
jgi:hypothetical protein